MRFLEDISKTTAVITTAKGSQSVGGCRLM